MTKIPFKVSAKAARLIGRENVANADGAIAELVKNTYDADATLCLICFCQRYSEAPEELSNSEYQWLFNKVAEEIELFYEKDQNTYVIREITGEEENWAVNNIIAKIVDLWIVDNGTGMNAKTIEEQWMVIGTNYKEVNAFSEGGRTRTGAKGIGRFALDRLGTTCQLRSTVNNVSEELESITWNVDWSSFDGTGKVLDEITAEFHEDEPPISETLKWIFSHEELDHAFEAALPEHVNWTTGTSIKIGLLRDKWLQSDVDHLNRFLSALIPPIEQRELNIFLFDTRQEVNFGLISPGILDDFDYKIDAKVLEAGEVEFDIHRNELNHDELPLALFELDEMKKTPFDADSFKTQTITYTKSFFELFPNQTEEFLSALGGIGTFEVNLMFFKKGRPNKEDLKQYPYRNFQPGARKVWLEEFGGIKIYRDNFLVRPYGEVDGKSFDWLTLGQRVAVSPVAASRKGWKVSPQNLAGTVRISRSSNLSLNDQANREGIIENNIFSGFKALILRIVQEFENDRSCIHYNLNQLYRQQNKFQQAKADGRKIAVRVKLSPAKATTEDAHTLALAFEAQQEEIKELRDEQSMLRSLATLGTVLVSFSHEMGQLQNTMGSRSSDLSGILNDYISQDELEGVKPPFNPFVILENWEAADQKVKHWFTFALSSVRSDKRRRKWISLRDHLDVTTQNWSGFLTPREVMLEIKFLDSSDPKILAFEIDLDSVFNNLILNSVEALLSPNHNGSRHIEIYVSKSNDNEVKIEYRDNGPGLHPSIKDPRAIFNFAVTTKVDRKGNVIGTGLGLWILDAVVSHYGGFAKAYVPDTNYGFRMDIKLPTGQ